MSLHPGHCLELSGALFPSSCPAGQYKSGCSCDICAAGKYTETLGNTVCVDCKDGYLCVEGSSAPQPCPGGTYANQTVLSISGFLNSLDECIVCPAGTSCSVGSAEPKLCLPGSLMFLELFPCSGS